MGKNPPIERNPVSLSGNDIASNRVSLPNWQLGLKRESRFFQETGFLFFYLLTKTSFSTELESRSRLKSNLPPGASGC